MCGTTGGRRPEIRTAIGRRELVAQVARIADALEVGVKVHRDPVCDWCPPGYERARAVEARLTAIWVPPDPASTSYDPGKGGSGVVARLGAT